VLVNTHRYNEDLLCQATQNTSLFVKPMQLRIFSYIIISFDVMNTNYSPAILTSMMPAVLDLMQTNTALFTLFVRYLVQVIFCFHNGSIFLSSSVYQQ